MKSRKSFGTNFFPSLLFTEPSDYIREFTDSFSETERAIQGRNDYLEQARYLK
jgi:hypothetical protein